MNPLINYNEYEYMKFIDILKNINYNKIISLEFLNNNINYELQTLNAAINNFVKLCFQ